MPRIGVTNVKSTNSVSKKTTSTASKPKKFDHTNFNQALKHSAESGKPMVIKVGASWCGPCRAMNNSTFKDPKVQARLEKDATFVNVEVDRRGDTRTQREAAQKIAKALGVRAYPTVIMANVKQSGDKLTPSLVSKGNMMNATSFQRFLDTGLTKAEQMKKN